MKASIPKGTRDFSPAEVKKRHFIIDTMKEVFELYGYVPIETPAMENLSTLLGKYGEEGEKLLFKILNSGDYLSKADEAAIAEKNSRKLTTSISKKGLRYDLTVPLARYVVMHRNDITFPFKRYQIQPVWRADRPQKGRYQEFWQCDIDVVGSESPIYDAELLMIYATVFNQLGLDITIRVNHRSILEGVARHFGIQDSFESFITTLDKLDKKGYDGVAEELADKGMSVTANSLRELKEAVYSSGKTTEQLLNGLLNSISNDQVKSGTSNLSDILKLAESNKDTSGNISFDLYLARGLDYYTGMIVEVDVNSELAGSVAGGGRYDELTGLFDMPGIKATGGSFGLDRIYDAMDQAGIFKDQKAIEGMHTVILPLDKRALEYGMNILSKLRDSGVHSEIYPGPSKLSKQMKYADERGATHTIIIGEEEMNTGKLSLKQMQTGDQDKLSIEEIIEKFGAGA